MIISHSHKYIYIKSLKTGGTSVEAALSNHCSGSDIVTPLGDYRCNRDKKDRFIHQSMNAMDYQQHDSALTIRSKVPAEIWANYYKFSIARNPWDRAVSYFYWAKRQDPAINPRKRFYHYLGFPSNKLGRLRIMFSDFIKTDEWKINDSFYIIDDRLCVDFVIRYENLFGDFEEVCKELGLPSTALPRLKAGFRQQRYHYSEYFDEESKAIVAKKHKNDIRFFGYEFEGV